MSISSNEIEIVVYRDKKNYIIKPYSRRIENGILVACRTFSKLKRDCVIEKLGQEVLACVDYAKQYPTHRFEEEKQDYVSWKNTEKVSIKKHIDGSYSISAQYRDMRCNMWDIADVIKLPIGTNSQQLGEALVNGFERCDIYAGRAQFMMYLSEKEGLKIVAMAISKQGNYVMSDYCEHIILPYDSEKVKAAIDRVVEYAKHNPTDKRSDKERKANQPWRPYSRFKSWHGFVKDNHAIEVMVLSDGNYVISPTMRFDEYDSNYVSYPGFSTVLKVTEGNNKLFRRIFKSLETSKHLSDSKADHLDFKEPYYSFFDRWLSEKGLPSWRLSDDES